MRVIEGRLRAELLDICLTRSPKEAVGLILSGDKVVELPNLDDTKENKFLVHRSSIVKVLENEFDTSDIVLWHSHPNGGIGPSRIDIQNKGPFPYHLVLALNGVDFIESWY